MKKKSPKEKDRRYDARRNRVRRGLTSSDRPRLTVFRSSKHIYAQIVDARGRTLVTVSSRVPGLMSGSGTGNVEAAKKVGAEIAREARERQIEKVVFNRNGFLYHGRVKALADAAREAGLSF
jgi:large subunit ribosomal protein L18